MAQTLCLKDVITYSKDSKIKHTDKCHDLAKFSKKLLDHFGRYSHFYLYVNIYHSF